MGIPMTPDMDRKGFLGLLGLGVLGAQTVDLRDGLPAEDPEPVGPEGRSLAEFERMANPGWIDPEEIRRIERSWFRES